jgi:hypothetical protein
MRLGVNVFLKQKHVISNSFGSKSMSSNSGDKDFILIVPSNDDDMIAYPSFIIAFDIFF